MSRMTEQVFHFLSAFRIKKGNGHLRRGRRLASGRVKNVEKWYIARRRERLDSGLHVRTICLSCRFIVFRRVCGVSILNFAHLRDVFWRPIFLVFSMRMTWDSDTSRNRLLKIMWLALFLDTSFLYLCFCPRVFRTTIGKSFYVQRVRTVVGWWMCFLWQRHFTWWFFFCLSFSFFRSIWFGIGQFYFALFHDEHDIRDMM